MPGLPWITLALLSAASVANAQQGFIQLFNGKDLTGWKVGGNVPSFTVQDGAIVSHGPTAHCFYDGDFQNHNFKNFELMVDIMTVTGWLKAKVTVPGSRVEQSGFPTTPGACFD